MTPVTPKTQRSRRRLRAGPMPLKRARRAAKQKSPKQKPLSGPIVRQGSPEQLNLKRSSHERLSLEPLLLNWLTPKRLLLTWPTSKRQSPKQQSPKQPSLKPRR